jgi:hypothetical protein
MTVINQGLGKLGTPDGEGISLEDLEDVPTGSVVYMGRRSFRMEAWSPANDAEQAIVQPITGVITTPYDVTPSVVTYVGHPDDETRGALLSSAPAAPAMPAALFGSQVDLPLLPPPTGGISVRSPQMTISRAALGGWGALIFASGVAISGGLHYLLSGSAAPMLGQTPIVATAPAPAKTEENEFLIEADVPAAAEAKAKAKAELAEPPKIALPQPVTIRVSKRAAQRRPTLAVGATQASAATKPTARWVDPFAE